MIEFQRVSAKWFLSLGVVSLDLDKRGLVYIGGKNLDDSSFDANGAGKSSVFEAIVWCLYGKTIRNTDADGVINERRPAGEGTEASVYFTLGGAHYVVSRYRDAGPNKNAVRVFKNLTQPSWFTSFKSGVHSLGFKEELTKKDSRETDALIVELLGMDYLTFTTVVFFGQGLSTRFAGMTDTQKKEIMERIIGLERFAKARLKAAEQIKDVGLQIQGATFALDTENLNHTHLLARYKSEREDHKRFSENKQARLKSIDEEIKELEAWVSNYDQTIGPALDAARQEATAKRPLVAKAREALSDAKAEVATARVRHSMAVSDTSTLQTQVSKAASTKTGVCGTCNQPITSATISAHVKEIQGRLAKAHIVCAEQRKLLDDAEAAFKAATNEFSKASTAYEEADATVNRLSISAGSYGPTKSEIAVLKAKRLSVAAEKNVHVARINKLVKEIKECRAKRDGIKKSLTDLKAELAVATYWERAFSNKGLRSLLLDASVPQLNKYAAEYSMILTDGNIAVEFSTQTQLKSGAMAEKFEVRVGNNHGGTGYGAASGGEAIKTDLIVGLSLQRLVASRARQVANIAVYDEAFIYLDDEAMERAVQLLVHEAKTKSSVFVITHEPALKQYFPTEITVTKRNGISSLK